MACLDGKMAFMAQSRLPIRDRQWPAVNEIVATNVVRSESNTHRTSYCGVACNVDLKKKNLRDVITYIAD